MKVRQSFCAFTKFRHLQEMLDKDVHITTKGLKYLQTLGDGLVLRQVTLLYQNIPNRTIRGKHVVFLLRAFQNMGLTQPTVATTSNGYSPRLGYHLVKRVDPKFRLGSDAAQELFNLYTLCLREILQTIRANIVDLKKRVTPAQITKTLEHSRLSALM